MQSMQQLMLQTSFPYIPSAMNVYILEKLILRLIFPLKDMLDQQHALHFNCVKRVSVSEYSEKPSFWSNGETWTPDRSTGFRIRSAIDRIRIQPLRTNRIWIQPLRTNRIRIQPLRTNRIRIQIQTLLSWKFSIYFMMSFNKKLLPFSFFDGT